MLGLHPIVDYLRHLPLVPPIHRRQARVLRARRPPESAARRRASAVLDGSRRRERWEGAARVGSRRPPRLIVRPGEGLSAGRGTPVGAGPGEGLSAGRGTPVSALIRHMPTRGAADGHDLPDAHPGSGRRTASALPCAPIRRTSTRGAADGGDLPSVPPARDWQAGTRQDKRMRAPSARADYPGLGATDRSRARAPPVKDRRIAPTPCPQAAPSPARQRARYQRPMARPRHRQAGQRARPRQAMPRARPRGPAPGTDTPARAPRTGPTGRVPWPVPRIRRSRNSRSS